MASDVTVFPGPIRVGGDIQRTGDHVPAIPRSNIAMVTARVPIFLSALRKSSDGQPLAATASGSDLGYVPGTAGTDFPQVQGSSARNTTIQQKARATIVLPFNYEPTQTVKIVALAGMKTTVAAGGGALANLTVKAWKSNGDGTVGSNLGPAAQSINSLVAAEKPFSLTSGGFSPGDSLDVEITIDVTDSANTGAVIPRIIGDLFLETQLRG